MLYATLKYEGQLTPEQAKNIVRSYGGYPFALHIFEDGISFVDMRLTHSNSNRLKRWQLDQIECVLNIYCNVMDARYPKSARIILVPSDKVGLLKEVIEKKGLESVIGDGKILDEREDMLQIPRERIRAVLFKQ